MAQMNMIEAIRSALDVVMDKDPNVIVLGEDVGYFGGVFRCTDGLQRVAWSQSTPEAAGWREQTDHHHGNQHAQLHVAEVLVAFLVFSRERGTYTLGGSAGFAHEGHVVACHGAESQFG